MYLIDQVDNHIAIRLENGDHCLGNLIQPFLEDDANIFDLQFDRPHPSMDPYEMRYNTKIRKKLDPYIKAVKTALLHITLENFEYKLIRDDVIDIRFTTPLEDNKLRMILNSIRRISMHSIVRFAFDDIQFTKNKTSLPDEYIDKKITMTPIVHKIPLCITSCRSQNCDTCSSEFNCSMNIACDDKECIQVLSDIINIEHDLLSPYKGMPILLMTGSDELSLTGKLKPNTAKTHIKWSSVHIARIYTDFYNNPVLSIEVAKDINPVEILQLSVKEAVMQLEELLNFIEG